MSASRSKVAASHAQSNATRTSAPAAPKAHSAPRATRLNHVMQALVRESLVQPKLSVSEPGDYLERQADHVADVVMGTAGGGAAAAISRAPSATANLLSRKCKQCEEESVSIENRLARDDENLLIHLKRDAGAAGDGAGITSQALGSLSHGGEPLPPATREFFEQRMGHDFSAVRIHHDPNAHQLAAAAQARAFTRANHVVFRVGEYSPLTFGGRHLLAHELAHTIQQGAATPTGNLEHSSAISTAIGSAPPGVVQRVCTFTAPPPGLACRPADTSTGTGTPILFGLGASVLSAAAKATISSVAAAWHSGGSHDLFRLDGFASCDGAAADNWHLSCARAQAVAAELTAPSDGSPGVDAANIDALANGETNQFSATSFGPNRRVEITTDAGTPPPGPPCGLAITGPLEVDHYCAAYVPSDAASCGVFPAPNIKLNVTGAAARATLRWAVTRGSARASLVGPVNTTSVDVQGDAASVAQGDVTVQVSDGSCTATHFITVREPSDITPAQNPSTTPTRIANIITYTVRDQFGNPMGANICVDETITVCANSHPSARFVFGDAGTNAAGQVRDSLTASSATGIPASLCVKTNQSLTVGGCGPVRNNTIAVQASGITLTPGASCAAGDPCP